MYLNVSQIGPGNSSYSADQLSGNILPNKSIPERKLCVFLSSQTAVKDGSTELANAKGKAPPIVKMKVQIIVVAFCAIRPLPNSNLLCRIVVGNRCLSLQQSLDSSLVVDTSLFCGKRTIPMCATCIAKTIRRARPHSTRQDYFVKLRCVTDERTDHSQIVEQTISPSLSNQCVAPGSRSKLIGYVAKGL